MRQYCAQQNKFDCCEIVFNPASGMRTCAGNPNMSEDIGVSTYLVCMSAAISQGAIPIYVDDGQTRIVHRNGTRPAACSGAAACVRDRLSVLFQ